MTVVFTTLFDRISEAPGYNGVVLVALLGAGATSTNLTADLRSDTSTGSATFRRGRPCS